MYGLFDPNLMIRSILIMEWMQPNASFLSQVRYSWPFAKAEVANKLKKSTNYSLKIGPMKQYDTTLGLTKVIELHLMTEKKSTQMVHPFEQMANSLNKRPTYQHIVREGEREREMDR